VPASDILLSADVRQQIPLTPIGRLSAIDGGEVATYLAKVKEYEIVQTISSPLSQDKAWMKNVAHVIGGNEPALVAQLGGYMNKYKQIISDTLFGGNVTTFTKSSTETIQAISDQRMKDLFAEGLNQVAYFGHSSATVLDFNLDNPEEYNNPGKYPLFIAMGCLAGNFFNFNHSRFYTKETLSERWLLTPNRGAIAFIASSHFGIPHYLDIYNTKTYTNEARTMYGKAYGEILRQTVIDVFAQTSQLDFYARMHTEQNTYHGDPAIHPNTHLKPDYVIEDPMVKASPSFISVADTIFKIDAKYFNQGRSVNKDISIRVERKLPGGNFFTISNDTIPGIRFVDSVSVVKLHINPTTDQGLNQIRVTIDADNAVDESWENNNTITKDVFIFEDDARPVYPLNYAIINKQNIKLYASTANPFSPSKQYRMEIDTTTFFNSSFKRTVNVTAAGGLLEFSPGITFIDSTVYYWRVSPIDGAGNPSKWHEATFVYLPNSDVGFNQSHFYQHTKSFSERVFLDSTNRTWEYHPVLNSLFIRSGQYPTSSPNAADYDIAVNGHLNLGPSCGGNELIINVFDPISFQPMPNPTGFLYGSSSWCGLSYNRQYNFLYSVGDTASRRKAREFLENIVPEGAYVSIRSSTQPWGGNTYASVWEADTAYYGPGISLYHTLKGQGFTSIDNYDTTNGFVFVYKKNSLATYTPSIKFAENIYDRILLSVVCPTPDTLGYITSPAFGAAKQWKQLKWRGSTVDVSADDQPTVDIIGIDNAGIETTIMSGLNAGQQDVDISTINAAQYPFLKLRMRNLDSVNLTPYQLRYWRLTYVPIPEGALTPNVFFQFKDTLDPGEPLDFKVAFKNISEANFDSLRVKLIVTDRNNVQHVITPSSRFKPLISGDTLHVRNPTTTTGLSGLNTFYLDVNPDNDQPEQFHFNNFMYRTFYVRSDKVNPLLDVTFDGVHILNRDIVASKPHITIKLKDESKWLLLNDTAGAQIQVRYPNGVKRSYFFNTSDTLKFTPAGSAPNPDNTATIDFLPYFPIDGDYELTVTGKDRSGNTAGNIEYKVGFQVINKPMISNMLNYPNPFTTSTAFVFTITGAEVPQNIRIQIMTITGKIVREITKDELGPLHIGRNITEFKWDGTDQYGQKLANGIYLYRVITNLNGRSLDKYRSTEKDNEDNTDKYFNKGYGKMYLMR
ncbi:MAG TPA: C25 family cysteine peptidase, partial [Chitinophagaceae bacterium]